MKTIKTVELFSDGSVQITLKPYNITKKLIFYFKDYKNVKKFFVAQQPSTKKKSK